MNPGDVLIAIDRLKVNSGSGSLKRRLARFESGERITASVFRGDELLEAGLVLRAAPADTCYLGLPEAVAPDALARRTAWLGA